MGGFRFPWDGGNRVWGFRETVVAGNGLGLEEATEGAESIFRRDRGYRRLLDTRVSSARSTVSGTCCGDRRDGDKWVVELSVLDYCILFF